MGELVSLDERRPPDNAGNGAREALTDIALLTNEDDCLCFADWILSELWARGFKVVPLEQGDVA